MAEPEVILKDYAGKIWRFDSQTQAREAMRAGMELATEDDLQWEQTRREQHTPLGRAKAVGTGLVSMGTLGVADPFIEAAAPGYLRDVEEHNPTMRGIGELVPLVAATLTGGGGAASALARAAPTRTAAAWAGARSVPGIRGGGAIGMAFGAARGVGAKVEQLAIKKGMSPFRARLAQSVATEGVIGGALGAQHGFRQSAVEGADMDKTISTVLNSSLVGGVVGGALGLTLGGFNRAGKQTQSDIVAGLEARGMPRGTAEALGNPIIKRLEDALEGTAGEHVGRKILDYAKTHPDPEALIRKFGNKAEPLIQSTTDDVIRAIDSVADSRITIDKIAVQAKEAIVKAIASNPAHGSPAYTKLVEQIQGVAATGKRMEEFWGAKFHPSRGVTKSGAGRKLLRRMKTALEENLIGTETQQAIREYHPIKVIAESMARGTETWESHMGSAMVVSIDNYKRALFSGHSGILRKRSGGGEIGAMVREATGSLYAPAQKILETTDVVGKTFADFQRKFNAGTTDMMGEGGWHASFQKDWLHFPGRGKVEPGKWAPKFPASKSKALKTISNLGENSGTVGERLESLRMYLDTQKERAQAIIDISETPAGAVLEKRGAVAQARNAIKQIDDISKKLDPSISGGPAGDIEAANWLQDWKRFDQGDRNIHTGLMSGVMTAGYGLGAPGFMLWQGMRGAGAVGGAIQAPARTVEAVGALYTKSKVKNGIVSRGLDKVFKNKSKAPGVSPRPRRSNFIKDQINARKYGYLYLAKPQIKYEESIDAYRRDFADPDKAAEKVLSKLLPLGQDANDLRALSVAKEEAIRRYMMRLAPTSSNNPYMLGRTAPGSKAESERFNRVEAILRAPENAPKRMAEKKLTVDEVEALKTVWPQWFQDMQIQAMEKMVTLSESGETLPYQNRLQLAVLLDLPTDPTTEYKFIMESVLGYAQDKKRKPKPPVQRAGQSRLAKSYQSESQKTAEGEYQ